MTRGKRQDFRGAPHTRGCASGQGQPRTRTFEWRPTNAKKNQKTAHANVATCAGATPARQSGTHSTSALNELNGSYAAATTRPARTVAAQAPSGHQKAVGGQNTRGAAHRWCEARRSRSRYSSQQTQTNRRARRAAGTQRPRASQHRCRHTHLLPKARPSTQAPSVSINIC